MQRLPYGKLFVMILFAATVFLFGANLASAEVKAEASVIDGSAPVAVPTVAPVALDDTYRTNMNTSLSVSAANGVLANDSDAENSPLTANLISGPNNGVLTLNPNGSFTYAPNTGFSGVDTFTYRAFDGGLESNTATVTINVIAPALLSIPSNIAATSGGMVTVPVLLNKSGNNLASLIFAVKYDQACLTISPADANNDTIPDAVSFNLPAGVSRGAQLGAGQLNVVITSVSGNIPNGTILNIAFQVSAAPSCAGTTSSITFSMDPAPTSGDTGGGSVPVNVQTGSVSIGSGTQFGDCNRDGNVDAGDISGVILEIFDGDGANVANVASGSFFGGPGCDANNDTIVNAADITCTVLIIFNGPNACVSTTAATSASAQLAIADYEIDLAKESAKVDISLASNGNDVTAATFVVNYDAAHLEFDATDKDGDGLPDAMSFPFTAAEKLVNVFADEGRLAIALVDIAEAPLGFNDGAVMTIRFNAKNAFGDETMSSELTFSADEAASLSNRGGQSLTVTTADGSVTTIPAEVVSTLYLPLISAGE